MFFNFLKKSLQIVVLEIVAINLTALVCNLNNSFKVFRVSPK